MARAVCEGSPSCIISSLYCFIGGVCRLDRVGELNSEKNQLLRFVFLSFLRLSKLHLE